MSIDRSILFFSLFVVAIAKDDAITSAIYEPDIEPYNESGRTEKPIFDYRKNGVKIDVRIVPAMNQSIVTNETDDNFPDFPMKDIGRCVIDFSLICIQRRFARYLDIVGHLNEITLFGQNVKLVKSRKPIDDPFDRRMIGGISDRIERSIDDFFNSFALRIILPRWNGKKNQIDIMMDDTAISEFEGSI